MTTLAPWTEQWQPFRSDIREQFGAFLGKMLPNPFPVVVAQPQHEDAL